MLLLAIFQESTSKQSRTRWKISRINAGLAKLDNGNTVRCLDIGSVFRKANGTIAKEVMADSLHPTAVGYQSWADAMRSLFTQMVKKPTAELAR